jgi:hypothetical protein
MCVLGVGERAVALWVRALPAPGIRALIPQSAIAAIARQTSGTRGQLLMAGRAARLPVRYDVEGDVAVDAFVRRLRRRAAGDPAPVPAGYSIASGRRRTFDPEVLRLDPDDDIAAAGRPGLGLRRTCLVTATPRELVILRSVRSASPSGWLTDSLNVPRHAIEDAASGRGRSCCAAPGWS